MIVGFLEAIYPFRVVGWAYDIDRPDAPISVSIIVSGREIGKGIADIFRADLLQDGKGNGKHGFSLTTAEKLPIDAPQSIEAWGHSHSGDSCQLTRAAEISKRSSNQSTILGYFEVSSAHEIMGWAYDTESLDDAVTVTVFADDFRIGTVIADQSRPDLLEGGIGNGRYGFVLTTESALTSERSVLFRAEALSPSGRTGSLVLIEQPQEAAAISKLAPLSSRDQKAAQDHQQRPVFVLGAGRSGTTAMAQALVRATRYLGYEEGYILDLVGSLTACVRRHYEDRRQEWAVRRDTMIAAVPQHFFEHHINRMFIELSRSLFPGGYWVDKTPRYESITAAPLLRQIWPQARFIYMRRRGIENILSRIRKFPSESFESDCEDWSTSMHTWISVRPGLAGVALEVDQLALANRPTNIARAVASLLGLDADELATLSEVLRVNRPQRTGERFGAVTPLSNTGWTEDQRDIFLEVCGPMMDSFGYSIDERYFSPGREGDAVLLI